MTINQQINPRRITKKSKPHAQDFFLSIVSLKADGQSSFTPHLSQRGLSGVHIVCPNPTCIVHAMK